MATDLPTQCRLLLSIPAFSLLFSGLGSPALAQDSEFLACARFEDRAQRIACLEDALEAAVPDSTPAAPAAAIEENMSTDDTAGSIDDFGQARIEENKEGEEALVDTITNLERRRDLWRITLSSGQTWVQSYPRVYNLRQGDEVRIYQEGIGDGYRLATERLSGFIRVQRLQ